MRSSCIAPNAAPPEDIGLGQHRPNAGLEAIAAGIVPLARVLLPGCQLCRIQTLLASPVLRVAPSIPAVAISTRSRAGAVQRWLPPVRQRSNLARHLLHRRTLRRQQSRHDFDPCTPVRIEPRPDVRAHKGSRPIRATISLTQGAASAPRQADLSRQITFALFNRSIPLA